MTTNRNLLIGSAALLAFIATWEGVKTKPYEDVGGIPTVCAGHTGDDVEDRVYKPEECAAILRADVAKHAEELLALVQVPLSQGELDAYQSFVFNVGSDAFSRSTLLRKLNADDRAGACNELLRWNRAGGKVMRGLARRRMAERELCLRGVYESESGSVP